MTQAAVPISEAAFQQTILAYAALTGWRFCHFRPARTARGWRTPIQGHQGFPDISMVRRERLVFVEVKAEKGRATPEQMEWLAALALNPGVECYLWRPSDWPTVEQVLR